ncbi:MAG: Hsp20/alpha crystallin family protein [Burkholderiaceae bacterium]|nr:Hsp20/alpha crystallin family protein [Burkholderiaceae bacterium]MCX7902102.1 Hsp20/alpha crystallin family protein [Burkholderiaceae bacterium]
MNVLTEFKRGLEQAWDALAAEWRQLRARAASALTRFTRTGGSTLPAEVVTEVPPMDWGLLAVDVFDDDERVVVRLEAPGMRKDDFRIEVRDDVLWVEGEKRFEQESTRGRYRLMQCAYGRFQRAIGLPVPVQGDKARATYRDGVLRIELPKAASAVVRRIPVKA